MRLMLTVLIVLLLEIFEIETVSRCDRTPDRVLRPKNSEDTDKYVIEILDDPTSYVPGEHYTVFLKYNPLLNGVHMFREFMLSVEQENGEAELEQAQDVGYLKLTEDTLAAFSRKCENTVLQTSSVPKSSIQVYWIAPPTGSGCVAFRATVVETKENWYSDDGSLTKILCEEEDENQDVQPSTLSECCACDEAKYELVFEGLWTRNTHPKVYPSNIWGTKFGDIIGASHTNDYSFWQYGGYANHNLKELGERGQTSGIESELKEKMGTDVRTIIKANGLKFPNITGKTFTFFRVDSKSHLVSFVTKITPSPDWVLGVSNFELCLRDCNWVERRTLNLYPWDIGTDDGVSYSSVNQPTDPPEPIAKIESESTESPFFDSEGKEMKPFAKLYLNRLKIYKKDCAENAEMSTTSTEEGTTEEGVTKDCKPGPWSDWSPCSEKCGKGFMFRKRELLEPENEDICSVKLVDQKSCGKKCGKGQQNLNQLPADDPKCELMDWGEWSSCTVPCGKGTMTRDKKFKNPEFATQCENNDPSILQQNEECDGEDKNCPKEQKESNCSKADWGPWSPCNVTCGTGVKTRLRMPNVGEGEDEITESECSNMEEVNCYEPLCEGEVSGTTGSNYGGITSLNQVTTENIFSAPFGPVANCKVSDWSVWGPCELNEEKCGKGYRTQHRQILQHAFNGGKSCPRKLMRKKRCNVPCHHENESTRSHEISVSTSSEPVEITTEYSVDCIMSPWSQWSPCSLSCGGSAVQQRTRSIKRPARKNGKPCGPRLDQRPCPLPLACSDKGVPIMK